MKDIPPTKTALCACGLLVFISIFSLSPSFGADRLVGIQSARPLSQSLPWIAEEAGLFQKYNLDFQLVYIASSGMATAAMLGGDAELAIDARALKVKPQDLVDRRCIDEMEKSGFFEKLWTEKK
jgi:hypothetical protein